MRVHMRYVGQFTKDRTECLNSREWRIDQENRDPVAEARILQKTNLTSSLAANYPRFLVWDSMHELTPGDQTPTATNFVGYTNMQKLDLYKYRPLEIDRSGKISQVLRRLEYLDRAGGQGRSNKARLVKKREQAVPQAIRLIATTAHRDDISSDQLKRRADEALACKIEGSKQVGSNLISSFPTGDAHLKQIQGGLQSAASTLKESNVVGKFPGAFANEVDGALSQTEALREELSSLGEQDLQSLRARIAPHNSGFARYGTITSNLVEAPTIDDAEDRLSFGKQTAKKLRGLVCKVLPRRVVDIASDNCK